MTSFRSPRHNREILLADWRDAEELAAWFMREELGMKDARVTGSGNDRGIDVIADGGVAQVKHLNVPVGAPVVQAALGAGHGRGGVLFFALSGYTRQAKEFATRSGLALFQYNIYGDVRACNAFANGLADKYQRAKAQLAGDPALNALRSGAAPALAMAVAARERVDELTSQLECRELEDTIMAQVLVEYSRFLTLPNDYQAAYEAVEAAWAELRVETDQGTFRVSKTAVDTGLREIVKLYEEVEDLSTLRNLTPIQWLRTLADWLERWHRVKFLLMDARYPAHEAEPPLESFELHAAIRLSTAAHPVHKLASRWADVLAGKPVQIDDGADPCSLMASSYKDPIGQEPERNFALLEAALVGGVSEDPSGPHRVYALGWSLEDIDRLRSLAYETE